MYFIKQYPWLDPLNIALSLSTTENNVAFLYSAKKYTYSGDYSFLAWEADKEIDDFKSLQQQLSSNCKFHENLWFGYLGYEVFSTTTQKQHINLPPLYFFKAKNLLIFDHQKKRLSFFSSNLKTAIDDLLSDSYHPPINENTLSIYNLSSNMTKQEYIEKVNILRSAIVAGDFYQANLTRKFFGNIANKNPFTIFQELSMTSPAPYSAYFKFNNNHILSSSPERFINISSEGKINSRPIKGTLDRNKNKKILQNSSKDKAENLMIVDLMRNDIARSAKVGSVSVDQLFHIDSFTTLHHMSSSINGTKKPSVSTLQAIKSSFPPGSMTGTPKIAAINALKKLENYNRNIYSGCLGYFAGDGSCDLSVVIRTIIIQNKKFEFQVGGAIIYDSDPHKEWHETLIKSKGICKALKITLDELSLI